MKHVIRRRDHVPAQKRSLASPDTACPTPDTTKSVMGAADAHKIQTELPASAGEERRQQKVENATPHGRNPPGQIRVTSCLGRKGLLGSHGCVLSVRHCRPGLPECVL